MLLANPVVAMFFELQSEIRPTGLDHATIEHDVDEIWLDVVQDTLIVCNDEHTEFGS
jgi:hypothetical protein